MRKPMLMASTAVAASAFAHGLALAQTGAATTSSQPQAGAIEEIIVTAQKRTENLQSVPISVSAVGGEALEARGVVTSRGLQDVVPGVKVQGVNAPAVFVRGVGTSNSSSTGDQGVALHLDGVFHGRPTAFAAGFLDLERVEVLKGPQGTLYGRGALGGNVNVISKAPVQTFEGSGAIEVGNYDQLRTTGVINVPVNDKLAVRAAFQTDRHDGYSSNGGDDTNMVAARFRALWKPIDKLQFDLIAFYSSNEARGATGHFARDYPRYVPSDDPMALGFPDRRLRPGAP